MVCNKYIFLFIYSTAGGIYSKENIFKQICCPLSKKKKNKIEHVQPHCVHCEAYQVISLFPHYQNENVSTLFTCEVSGWRTKSKQEGQR